MRTKSRPNARAMELPSEVFPVPGGPAKQRIGPRESFFSLSTARYSRIRSFTLSRPRSEEHTSELQSLTNLVCRLLLEKKKKNTHIHTYSCTIPHLQHRNSQKTHTA